nr:SDR family NAD(P)-dependent oxidoreductase [Pseudomonas sp.]
MNKVVLVTGASRGIGRETALAFARAGFDVAISARTLEDGQQHDHSLTGADGKPLPGSLASVAREIQALGREAWCIPMDLLDTDSVLAAADQVVQQAGRLDVLVNNAVYQGRDLNSMFIDLTLDTLERMFKGYVLAPVLLTQKLLPALLEHGEGVVINVTSGAGESNPPVAADRGGWGYAYGAGKAAVSRLSGVLKAELGHKGLRSYTVNPGVVTTEALQATIGEAGIKALGAGSAPPQIPAAVMCWLAASDVQGLHQKRTLHAQPFALEQGIVADWRAQEPA